MKPKSPSPHKQGHLFYPDLLDHLNPKDPLLVLAQRLPWGRFEEEFAPLYSEAGRPAKPVRLMVGLLLLKQIEVLSDERVVAAWVRNPYYQAFCGVEHFQWHLPCDPSDLVHFRKRIGEAGVDLIFTASVADAWEESLGKRGNYRHYRAGKEHHLSHRHQVASESHHPLLEIGLRRGPWPTAQLSAGIEEDFACRSFQQESEGQEKGGGSHPTGQNHGQCLAA
jgi:IS5 family transposase